MNYSLQMMNTRFKMYNNKDLETLENTLDFAREIYQNENED